MAREQITKNKVVFGDLGNPQGALANAPADTKRVLLGRIIGVATGTVKRSSADKTETFIGLAGEFKATPVKPDEPETISGALFLPNAFMQAMVDAITNGASLVQFGLDVYAERATNKAGFTWVAKDVMPVKEGSALAQLEQEISKLAIEDKSSKKK